MCSFLISKIKRRGNIFRKNIWQTDLSSYDLVYAFLSPAIMEKLYFKVLKEMRQDTFFISNSFEVPNLKADEIWELEDKRGTKLFIYKIKK